ncbi:MAG TPA: TraB/GumN family protein [Candidatus Acidoferrales bacterium]|jgi:uncharacterized protein YbaP (TraB family)|nr:TraB/GumN family protein [Candidatus Acidoferrales bacterium]
MLWEIADTPHRMLGSMHVLPAAVSMPKWFAASHDGIERFVFECDYNQRQTKIFGRDVTRAHLKRYGAPDLYRRAKQLLIKNGVGGPLEDFKPWKAAYIIGQKLAPTYGFFGESGVEMTLRALVEGKKLVVEFFEANTRSSELTDEACKPFQDGLALLRKCLKEAESGAIKREYERQSRAWLTCDLADFAAIQREQFADFPFISGVHLQRNREWVAVAKKLFAETTPTLLVMGAFHTVGTRSFIELMEGEGFKFKFVS